MLTFEDIDSAWKAAQDDPDTFYECMEVLTGFTKDQIKTHFADWNKLSHEEAETIAERHGITLEEGGFQAYLAEVSTQDIPTESEATRGS